MAPNTVGKKYFKVIITLSINPHKSLKPGDPAKKYSEHKYFLFWPELKKGTRAKISLRCYKFSKKVQKMIGGFFSWRGGNFPVQIYVVGIIRRGWGQIKVIFQQQL